ncbi:hypothetical protein MUP77_06365 [Candidatus Bathyarchaeota archaeon]|nr:hypothetical protein [Candidatus Bathyarchaeota archaeon]
MQFVGAAIRNAEAAKWRLEHDVNLSAEEVKYLENVIRQGEYAQGIMNEVLRDRDAARKRGILVEHSAH